MRKSLLVVVCLGAFGCPPVEAPPSDAGVTPVPIGEGEGEGGEGEGSVGEGEGSVGEGEGEGSVGEGEGSVGEGEGEGEGDGGLGEGEGEGSVGEGEGEGGGSVDVRIHEVRAVGGSDVEFVELTGTVGTDVSALSLHVVTSGGAVVGDTALSGTIPLGGFLVVSPSLPDAAGTVRLIDSSGGVGGVVIDAFTWSDDPGALPFSHARTAAGTFIVDPSPTPGAENDVVTPAFISLPQRDDGLANGTTVTPILVRDIVDTGGAPLTATFVDVDSGPCTFVSALADGSALLTCTAPARAAGPARGDVVVHGANASVTGANAWTYTGVVSDVDFCNVQFPKAVTRASDTLESFFGRAFEPGVTDVAGFSPLVSAEMGIGTLGDDPRTSSNAYLWSPARTNVADVGDFGHDDEYRTDLSQTVALGSAPVTFGVLFRVSLDDGLNYTYCDAVDANGGFDPAAAAMFTVTP